MHVTAAAAASSSCVSLVTSIEGPTASCLQSLVHLLHILLQQLLESRGLDRMEAELRVESLLYLAHAFKDSGDYERAAQYATMVSNCCITCAYDFDVVQSVALQIVLLQCSFAMCTRKMHAIAKCSCWFNASSSCCYVYWHLITLSVDCCYRYCSYWTTMGLRRMKHKHYFERYITM
jgi:hypothetical protein